MSFLIPLPSLVVRSGLRFFCLISFLQVTAQQVPPNLGFETGGFTGWSAATGQCCPVYAPVPGFDPSRHAITSGAGTDIHSGGLIAVTAPGSLFSAKLGNDSGSAESEVLDYFFTVPSDSLLLVVRFAVVLENYNHPPSKQPRFRYEVQCPLPLAGCIEEEVIAGDPSYNFQLAGAYELLDWQTRIIDLTGYQGVTMNLHFETGDCEPGGHFGYAYVDAELLPTRINAISCNPDGSITLMAPAGIDVTWFDGSSSDSLVIVQPQAGTLYTLETACGTVLTTTLDDALPVSGFSAQSGCGLQVVFTDHSSAASGSVYWWDFGDGQTSSLESPVHTYNSYGIYDIELIIEQPNYCRSETIQTIGLTEPPSAEFHMEGTCVNRPIAFVNESVIPPGQSPQFQWLINGVPSYTEPDPVHVFSVPGLYEVMLVAGQAPCKDTVSVSVDIINSDSCFLQPPAFFLPNSFTPNGDGINDFFIAFGTDHTVIMTIYNRFGQLVFTGNRWDGSHGNADCPSGVYAVAVKSLNEARVRYATVSLIR